MAGMRGSTYDDREWEAPREMGMEVIPCAELRTLSPEEYGGRAHAKVGAGPAFLSFDIDVIDPGFAPATGTPEVAGLLPHEALAFVRSLAGLDFKAFDVVEVSPGYARNYLLPKDLAVQPTPGNIKKVEERRKEIERQERERRDQQAALLKQLEGVEVTLERRANEQGHLYGAVSATDIAKALQAQGYDTRLVENRDAHTYTGWRDTFDPNLVDLVRRVLDGPAAEPTG